MGDAICMTARPAGLPQSDLQDVFFEAGVSQGRLADWWGSELEMSCDSPWDMLPMRYE